MRESLGILLRMMANGVFAMALCFRRARVNLDFSWPTVILRGCLKSPEMSVFDRCRATSEGARSL
jgi:hypothetical protein